MDYNSFVSDDLYDDITVNALTDGYTVVQTLPNQIIYSYPSQYLISGIEYDDIGRRDGKGKETYGGEHTGEFLICTWKNGMKNGEGILYNMYGEVLFRGTFVDDYIEGDGYIFEDGVIVIRAKYQKSIIDTLCYIEVTPDHIIMIERSNNGFLKYRGGFNEEFGEREGLGAEYDSNGHLNIYGMYEGNVLVQKIKRFEKDIMFEFDKDEHLIYHGHYRDDLASGFPREGQGREFKDGIQIFKGMFTNGKRNGVGTLFHEHGIAKERGVWKDGVQIESHPVDALGYFTDVKFDGRSHAFIRVVDGVETVSTHIRHIKLASGMCNAEELTKLELDSIHQLVTIEFGNRCFVNVKTVIMSNLPYLQRVTIGDDCFTFCDRLNDRPWDNHNDERILQENRTCVITNCKRLEAFSCGIGSFSAFIKLSLKELPSLQHLSLGVAHVTLVDYSKCSYCFFWAEELIIENLPSLQTIDIGCRAFGKIDLLKLQGVISNQFITM